MLPHFYRALGSRTVEQWSRDFYETVLSSNRLFRGPGNILYFVSDVYGPKPCLSLTDFMSAFYALVNPVKDAGDGLTCSVLLTQSECGIIFGSDAAGILPQVDAVVREPVAVLQPNSGTYRITSKPGLDIASRIYYWLKAGESPIEPHAGTEHLNICFSALPFANAGSKANLFAWLLSAVTLDPRLSSPLLTVSGNQQGVGKTSLVQAAGVILTGNMPHPITHTGEEFEKQLSSSFIDGNRFILIDNVVGNHGTTFKNDKLARQLTAGWSKTVRVLGHSRHISQAGVLFALTANDAKLDADLSTRAIPVQLHIDIPKGMDPYCVNYAFAHRRQLYGELLHLVLNPKAGHYIAPDAFRYKDWFQFVAPRIVPNFGPLALGESVELDERAQELFSWGINRLDSGASTFKSKELLTLIEEDPSRYPALTDHLATKTAIRARQISLGLLISSLLNKPFMLAPGQIVRLSVVEGANHDCKEYQFSWIEDVK